MIRRAPILIICSAPHIYIDPVRLPTSTRANEVMLGHVRKYSKQRQGYRQVFVFMRRQQQQQQHNNKVGHAILEIDQVPAENTREQLFHGCAHMPRQSQMTKRLKLTGSLQMRVNREVCVEEWGGSAYGLFCERYNFLVFFHGLGWALERACEIQRFTHVYFGK